MKCPNCKRDLCIKQNTIMVVCPCGETLDLKEVRKEDVQDL